MHIQFTQNGKLRLTVVEVYLGIVSFGIAAILLLALVTGVISLGSMIAGH